MSRKRKTIDVAQVKDFANSMLANSTDDMADGRVSVAVLLERVLMDTGNYRGFQYLETVWGQASDGTPQAVSFGDETRRRYY